MLNVLFRGAFQGFFLVWTGNNPYGIKTSLCYHANVSQWEEIVGKVDGDELAVRVKHGESEEQEGGGEVDL